MCKLVYTKCYVVKSVCCFVHTMSYYVKRSCCHDKRSVVMVIQCLIMLKGHGVMLNSRAVLSTRSFIVLKGYVIMLKIGLSCLRSM